MTEFAKMSTTELLELSKSDEVYYYMSGLDAEPLKLVEVQVYANTKDIQISLKFTNTLTSNSKTLPLRDNYDNTTLIMYTYEESQRQTLKKINQIIENGNPKGLEHYKNMRNNLIKLFPEECV